MLEIAKAPTLLEIADGRMLGDVTRTTLKRTSEEI